MRSKNERFIIGFLFFCSSIFLSCSTHQAPLVKENSLLSSELAFYSDSFDSFKEDLWEKAGYVFTATQLQNIRMANMTIEDGRLRIDTKTGGFSKGGWFQSFPSEETLMCRSIFIFVLFLANLIWIRFWGLGLRRNQNPTVQGD
jgi:hypothetical protein